VRLTFKTSFWNDDEEENKTRLKEKQRLTCTEMKSKVIISLGGEGEGSRGGPSLHPMMRKMCATRIPTPF
jgi:hypothetical protein